MVNRSLGVASWSEFSFLGMWLIAFILWLNNGGITTILSAWLVWIAFFPFKLNFKTAVYIYSGLFFYLLDLKHVTCILTWTWTKNKILLKFYTYFKFDITFKNNFRFCYSTTEQDFNLCGPRFTLLLLTDLKTMSERLKSRYYTTRKLFMADMQRIFTNCREYNAPESEYYKCANILEKFFYTKIKEAGLIEK